MLLAQPWYFKSFLKAPICGLQPLHCIEQLETNFSHRGRVGRKLLRLLDRKPDPIDCDSRLVCQFKLKGRGPTLNFSLD
jgi:hypothetical protein